MRHINEPPPSVRDKRPDVSPRLDAAVQRAMAKRPEDRFQTMAELVASSRRIWPRRKGPSSLRLFRAPGLARGGPARTRGRSCSALAVLIAIGTALAYVVIDRTAGGSGSNAGGGNGGAVPHLIGATAYDPFGTPPGQEHNDKAGLATDGISQTYWETERYFNHPSLNKQGVGLVLDAQKPVRLRQLGIATSTPGFVASIRAGDSSTGPFPDTVAPPQTVTDGTSTRSPGTPAPLLRDLDHAPRAGLHHGAHQRNQR